MTEEQTALGRRAVACKGWVAGFGATEAEALVAALEAAP
jgi:hypothetical protein